ncbi:c-type cytochrome [Lysobacter sp. A286]
MTLPSALLLALMLPFSASAQSAASGQSATPAVDEAQLQQGKQLYQHWCSACHARGPGHPGTQALEARYGGAMPAALEDRTNLSPEVVAIFVRNGISVMPFFRKTEINDGELAALGAYLSHNPPE